MNRNGRRMLALAGLWLGTAVLALAQEANLLANGDLAAGAGRSVPGWTFPPSTLPAGDAAALVDWGLAVGPQGERSLRVATKGPVKAAIWWQQERPAQGGTNYALSVRVRGTFAEAAQPGQYYATPQVGLYFYDEAGKWIGYQPMAQAAIAADGGTFQGNFPAPDNAAKLGVRLGVMTNGTAELFFDHVVLTETK